jgi:hypothetical protein
VLSLEANTEAILHALALCDPAQEPGGLTREQLAQLLPEPRIERKNPEQAVKNALGQLWGRGRKKLALPIKKRTPVVKLRDEPGVSVDLREFFRLAEDGHVMAAQAMVKNVKRLRLPESGEAYATFWADVVDKFDRVRAEVLEKAEARSGWDRRIADLHNHMLARSLVPWTEPQVPIGAVREKMETIEFPWRLLRGEKPAEGTMQAFLAGLLEDDDRAHPERLLITGGHGRGKTLAAIAVFLNLSEPDASGLGARPIVFADGHAESSEPGFATDAWLDARLHGSDRSERPVVIMPHADAFFGRVGEDLSTVLGWRLFRECDVLLCCGERFYELNFRYPEYMTYVARLEPWAKQDQDTYAETLYGAAGLEDLESWRDSDPTGMRADLCSVPLHLTFLLPLIRRDAKERARISKPWHLLDQLARERLRASHLTGSLETYLTELAAVAHRFYDPADAPDEAIGFSRLELEDFLELRHPGRGKDLVELLVNDTLITVPPKVSDEDRFERPVWGWFFTAYHLAHTLKLRASKEPPVRSFGKPFSPEVMGFCSEMLVEWMSSHEEEILGSLSTALAEDTVPEMGAKQREIARGHLTDLQRLLEGDC